MYETVYHTTEVNGIVPSSNGWMWPMHDNQFQYFTQALPMYVTAFGDLCKGFKVAVQAGGHCGMMPRLYATMFETVYTFEPDGYSFHCLVNNCQLDNIKKFNSALGEEHELIYQKYRGQHNVGVNFYGRPTEGENPIMQVRDVTNIDEIALVNIPQIRIDDLGLEYCDLIHLDVEGYEDNVLEGAWETLKKFKPVLALETVSWEKEQLLNTLGYVKIFADVGDGVFTIA
jgi:FkbM family methyltransferase